MPAEEIQPPGLDRSGGALGIASVVGAVLANLADAAALPPIVQEQLVSMIPSASGIGTMLEAVARDHRREIVICASGLGVLVSCYRLVTESTVCNDEASLELILAAQAKVERRKALEARRKRQRESTARATQLKLEAQAARAAARELTALAGKDERQLAVASNSTACDPVADTNWMQSRSELDDNCKHHSSPTKALRFAPSALSRAQTSEFSLRRSSLCTLRSSDTFASALHYVPRLAVPTHAIGELRLRSPPVIKMLHVSASNHPISN